MHYMKEPVAEGEKEERRWLSLWNIEIFWISIDNLKFLWFRWSNFLTKKSGQISSTAPYKFKLKSCIASSETIVRLPQWKELRSSSSFTCHEQFHINVYLYAIIQNEHVDFFSYIYLFLCSSTDPHCISESVKSFRNSLKNQ